MLFEKIMYKQTVQRESDIILTFGKM